MERGRACCSRSASGPITPATVGADMRPSGRRCGPPGAPPAGAKLQPVPRRGRVGRRSVTPPFLPGRSSGRSVARRSEQDVQVRSAQLTEHSPTYRVGGMQAVNRGGGGCRPRRAGNGGCDQAPPRLPPVGPLRQPGADPGRLRGIARRSAAAGKDTLEPQGTSALFLPSLSGSSCWSRGDPVPRRHPRQRGGGTAHDREAQGRRCGVDGSHCRARSSAAPLDRGFLAQVRRHPCG